MWKDRLRHHRSRVFEARQIRSRLEDMEARIYTPKGQRFTSMPHSPNTAGRSLDDLAIAHIALEDAYKRQLTAVEQEELAIEEALKALRPEQRMVIRAYYFDGLTWEGVCSKVHYGWSQVHRLHASALLALDSMTD